MNGVIKNERNWFTGNQLKYFAAVLMVCDHAHKYIFPGVEWLTMLGRLVAPIFIFMVAEGMFYTRNRKKYMLQLLIGAEFMNVMNIFMNRIFVFKPFDWDAIESGVPTGAHDVYNNIFATMFMIALVIIVVDYAIAGFKEKRIKQAVLGVLLFVVIVGVSFVENALAPNIAQFAEDIKFPEMALVVFVPTLFNTEGGMYVVFLGIAYYYLRRWRWAQMLALATIAVYFFIDNQSYLHLNEAGQWMMIFAAIFLFLYNGKRGKGVSPKFDKWFFYIFYPTHVYILFIIAWLLQR